MRELGLTIENITGCEENFIFDLKGYSDELEYSLVLKIKNKKFISFPENAIVRNIFHSQGDLNNVDKVSCNIKRFLTGEGNHEFFIYINPKDKTLVFDISEDNDENEFMNQLHTYN
ncbi:hypothetical protein [Aquimarina sp. AU58]|uniref:hypothetical protein n=1 Tax=Aquimarina sp. AU58 TaxID=1874112 RepID=UPI000D657EDB|nr:hypothetical protein [Aquimarina sp. AU58]